MTMMMTVATTKRTGDELAVIRKPDEQRPSKFDGI